jgi:hypothetical protein
MLLQASFVGPRDLLIVIVALSLSFVTQTRSYSTDYVPDPYGINGTTLGPNPSVRESVSTIFNSTIYG